MASITRVLKEMNHQSIERILAHSPVLIFETDQAGSIRCVYENALFGKKDSANLPLNSPRSLQDLFPDDEAIVPKLLSGIHQSISSQASNQIILNLKNRDIEIRFFPGGETQCLIVCKDITELGRLENLFLTLKERFNGLVESKIMGVFCWQIDGSIIDANDVFLNIMGYTREELEEGLLRWDSLTPSEFKSRDALAIQKLYAKGYVTPYEKQYIRKDGSRVDIYIGSAKFEEESDCGIAFILDITAQNNARRALMESEVRFKSMADEAPTLIWMSNAEGKSIYLNTTWQNFTGVFIPEGANPDDYWINTIHPQDYSHILAAVSQKRKSRTPFKVEYRQRRYDGEYRYMQSSASPWFNTDGTFAGYIGSAFDITDLKRATELANESNEKKNEFIRVITHELKTPLNVILGYSEMLQNELKERLDEKQARYIHNITTSGEHLLELINDILDMSKIESGQVSFISEHVDLNAFIRNQEVSFQLLAERKHVALLFHLAPGLSYVETDPSKLQQIFTNLISNAIKFNKEGGCVEVSLGYSGDKQRFRVEVKDTGIGIPEDKLSEIFNEFYQVDSSLTRRNEGTGLGLTVTKRLIDLQGGEIHVKSQEGVGSTFSFELPLKTAQPYALADFTKSIG